MDHGLHELDVFGGVPLRLERVELLGRESPGRFAWSSWLDDVRRGRPLLLVVGAGAAGNGDHACHRHYQEEVSFDASHAAILVSVFAMAAA